MLQTEKVRMEIKETVAFITLNRPEQRNALDGELWMGLEEAANKVRLTPEIRVAIVTGAGSAFCSGLDLKAASTPGGMSLGLSLRDGVETLKYVSDIFTMYETLPVPVIAAVNGPCIGAGMEVALACDIRIASDSALFSIPEVVYGLVPDCGGTQRLPRLIGPGMARELVLTGRTIDAREAMRIGLINHIYADEDLMNKAREMAEEIKNLSPEAVQAAKRALNMAMYTGLDVGLKYETAVAERVLGERAKEIFKEEK